MHRRFALQADVKGGRGPKVTYFIAFMDLPAQTPSLPELLAPAGSIEAFWAGYQAGADAFYLGAAEFNARRRAKNFTNDQLRDVILFAHRHKKKVYCALNTLVFDSEIPRLVRVLELLEEAAVDAVIVQDWGVIELVRTHFPRLRLHASTQMFCHNSQQARFLADAGFARIILARELSIDEMASIMAAVPLEYEAFVHGALCFSFSGCCLFSSHLFGASGNRGECRQPCRYPIDVDGERKYPFSMRDMQTLEILPEILRRLPLTSLKIEGRLRNAAYVGQVVRRYRAMLDAIRDGRLPPAMPSPIEGQRTTCAGFWLGSRYHALVHDAAPGAVGDEVGRVTRMSGGRIEFHALRPVRKGDRLILQTAAGKPLLRGTLIDFVCTGSRVVWNVKNYALCGRFAAAGCRIFRAGGNSAGGDPLRRIRKEASQVKITPVEIAAACDPALSILRLEARFLDTGETQGWDYPLTLSADAGLAWPEAAVEKILCQVDAAPFDVRAVRVSWPEGLWCRLSEIKVARRALYAALTAWHAKRAAIRRNRRRAAIEEECAHLHRRFTAQGAPRHLVYISASEPVFAIGDAELLVCDADLCAAPALAPSSRVALRLPLFVSESLLPKWRTRLHELVAAGYRQWMAPTYGWLSILRAEGVQSMIAGPFLYAVNAFAVRFLFNAGAERFVVSPDMREGDLEAVARYCGRMVARNALIALCVTRLAIPHTSYRLGERRLAVLDCGEYRIIYLCGS